MIETPKMWGIKKRIDFLKQCLKADPGDYMIEFELNELLIAYDKLGRIDRMGLKLVYGGLHPSSSSTDKSRQVS